MRVPSRAFPAPVGGRLRAALANAHARKPFSPAHVRDGAHRAARVVRRLGLEVHTFRGGLDLGGVELDHVWLVADDRVVDVVFPLFSDPFLDAVRSYVLGEVDDEDLEWAAHPYSVRWRVVGDYPSMCRYTGEPVWSEVRDDRRHEAGAR